MKTEPQFDEAPPEGGWTFTDRWSDGSTNETRVDAVIRESCPNMPANIRALVVRHVIDAHLKATETLFTRPVDYYPGGLAELLDKP